MSKKLCIQRKDLLEKGLKIPVGESLYLTIDTPVEYRCYPTPFDFEILTKSGWLTADHIDFDFIEPNPVSNSKHTPAPWKVSKHVDNGETVIRSKDGDIIANLDCDNVKDFMNDPKQETEANARLIAAAPDLLEALIKARTLLDGTGCESEDMHAIDSAIRKATIE